ncbi:ABC transporter substrate-binding protein [Paenibacillus oralis]|nr:ABC transporter substrate-binding protein [Paenibacillus oralis]
MSFKRSAWKAWMLGALALTLAACSASNGGSAENGGSGAPGDGGSASGGQNGQKVIAVSVVESNRFLDLAKQKFEAAHPDIRIEIKPAFSTPQSESGMARATGFFDPNTLEKYATTINADLMNGTASDLLVVDPLPYTKYADKKLLADMGEFMKDDDRFSPDNYYMNVFDALKYDGGLYGIPYSVSMMVWMGNQDRLEPLGIRPDRWTWKEFKEKIGTLAQDPSGSPLQWEDPGDWIIERVGAERNAFIDSDSQTAEFAGQKFIDLLEETKSLYDQKFFSQPDVSISLSGDKAGSELSVFFPVRVGDFAAAAIGHLLFANPAIYEVPSESGEQGMSFDAHTMLAINNKSPNKQEAWEFLSFLLTDEMQFSPELEGLPVLKKASEAQMEAAKNASVEGSPKATPEELNKIHELLSQVNRFAGLDPKIEAILKEETKPFFTGQKTAETVAKSIQNKVNLYLQE